MNSHRVTTMMRIMRIIPVMARPCLHCLRLLGGSTTGVLNSQNTECTARLGMLPLSHFPAEPEVDEHPSLPARLRTAPLSGDFVRHILEVAGRLGPQFSIWTQECKHSFSFTFGRIGTEDPQKPSVLFASDHL